MDFNLSMDGLAPYEPPISLWLLVEKHVSQNEWQEVKQILGESLVDQSLELHAEIETLLEIWKEYREETHEQLTCQRLPEPPAARDRLKQEILFFVESLRQKAADHGHNPDVVLKKYDSNVVTYVMADSRPSSSCSSRPMSARSVRDGRDTPMTARPSSSDESRLAQDLQQDLHEREDTLTSLNMDDVVSHLRETLEDEVKMLLQDIEFLQHCLDDEADFRSQSNFGGEPSLQDLRQSRSKLEKELLRNETSLHPSIKEPISKPAPSIKLKGSSLLSHPNQIIQCKNKSSPMKATHAIPTEHKTKGQIKVMDPHHQKDLEGFSQLSVRTRKVRGPPETKHTTVRARTLSGKTRSTDTVISSPMALVPSPPSSARPNSASKFRKMVLECRDGS